MKKQTDQQQKTHGKTTKDSHNKDKQQTNNKTLLSPKAGYNQHASLPTEFLLLLLCRFPSRV